MFCIKANKDRLKDWKNAIRIDGVPLRKLIDCGQLDFYRHSEFCTGRCSARHPLNRSANISSIAPEAIATTVSRSASSTSNTSAVQPSSYTDWKTIHSKGEERPMDIADTLYRRLVCPGPQESMDEDEPEESSNTAFSAKVEPGYQDILASPQGLGSQPVSASPATLPSAKTLRRQGSATGSASHKTSSQANDNDADDGDEVETVTVTYTQLSDDQQFWLGIVENGLCEEFFQDIHEALNSIKSDLITYCVRETDAYCLSNIVRELGLMTTMKDKLTALKSHTEQQQLALESEMQELKKKMAKYKAHKKALKRKSEKFDNLIAATTSKKRKVVKVVQDPEDALLCDSSLDDSSNDEEMEDNLPRKLQHHIPKMQVSLVNTPVLHDCRQKLQAESQSHQGRPGPTYEEEPLGIEDKLYERVNDVTRQLKFAGEALDAVDARMSLIKKFVDELTLVIFPAIERRNEEQNNQISKLQTHLDNLMDDLADLENAIDWLETQNTGNSDDIGSLENRYASAKRVDVDQDGSVANLHFAVKDFKAKLFLVLLNEFELFYDQVEVVAGKLDGTKRREKARMCETGSVTLKADDRKAEYVFQS
nr:hypothetical protein BaRGS_018226 [Batillaria attramentaria]